MAETPMIERLARAICRCNHTGFSVVRDAEIDRTVDRYWRAQIAAVGAVLAELENPSEAMVDAAAQAFDGRYEATVEIGASHWTDNRKSALDAAFRAMIRAAKETK